MMREELQRLGGGMSSAEAVQLCSLISVSKPTPSVHRGALSVTRFTELHCMESTGPFAQIAVKTSRPWAEVGPPASEPLCGRMWAPLCPQAGGAEQQEHEQACSDDSHRRLVYKPSVCRGSRTH